MASLLESEMEDNMGGGGGGKTKYAAKNDREIETPPRQTLVKTGTLPLSHRGLEQSNGAGPHHQNVSSLCLRRVQGVSVKVPAGNGERGLNTAGPRRMGDWHSPASSASAPGAFVRDEAFLVNGAKDGGRIMHGQENRTRVVIDGRKAGEGFDECFLKNRCSGPYRNIPSREASRRIPWWNE